MEEQVLSVEQMRELIGLGVDTSKASIYWVNNGEIYIPCIKYESFEMDESTIPTFTLQDILENVLPKSIIADHGKYKQAKFYLRMQYGLLEYSNIKLGLHTEIISEKELSPLLQAAFRLLKWCKENNHI